MAWSTTAPSGVTWSGEWTQSTERINVNNYNNYRIQARIGRGATNTVAVAVRLQVYGRTYGVTGATPLYASVKVGSGSWSESNKYDCTGSYGSWSTAKTIYYTGTANTNVTVQVYGSWQGNDTSTISFSAPPYTTKYTISYNANGGSGAPASQTKTYGTALTLSSTRPTRDGYNFLGWSTSSTATTATYQPGGSYTANANATLYAVWELITYTVTYNGNGADGGATEAQTKIYGTPLTLAQNGFTRANYTFLYWNTAADGSGTTYAAGASYGTNAALTLYAIWKKNNIPVYVNDNGTIRHVEKAYINIGGVIKECTVYANVGGVIYELT